MWESVSYRPATESHLYSTFSFQCKVSKQQYRTIKACTCMYVCMYVCPKIYIRRDLSKIATVAPRSQTNRNVFSIGLFTCDYEVLGRKVKWYQSQTNELRCEWCVQYLGHHAGQVTVSCLWRTDVHKESNEPASSDRVTHCFKSYTE